MHISALLLKHKVAATSWLAGVTMAGRHVRLVFSNEPVERLKVLGDRSAARSQRLEHQDSADIANR